MNRPGSSPRGPSWLASSRAGVLLAAGAALVAALLFAPCIGSAFVWDDRIVLEEQLPRFASARDVVWPPADIPEFSTQYYRPLAVASYLLDDAIVRALYAPDEAERGRRALFHATPVALHALASALVVALGLAFARLCGDGPRPLDVLAAGVAGLLFAVHPIHVESVAWIVGRADVLCALFVLASLSALIRYLLGGAGGWLAAAAGAALAAMLSKEIGLGSVAAHGFVLFLAGRTRRAGRNRIVTAAVTIAAVAGAYLALRASALQGTGLAGVAPRPGALTAALGWYAAKSLWPWPLSAFQLSVPAGWTHGLGLSVAAGWTALAIAALRRSTARLEALAATLFMASIAPSLAVVALGTTPVPVAERYLYLPSAGSCLLLAFLAARVRRGPSPVLPLLVLAALALPYGVSSFVRTATWSSELAFWEAGARSAPGAGFIQLHYGLALAEAGRPQEALAWFERAAASGGDAAITAPAQNHRGVLLMDEGRLDEALACFDRAIALDPAYAVPHFNRGVALLRGAARDPVGADPARRRARNAFEAALRLDGRYTRAHLELGALLWQLGEAAAARSHLQAVIDLAPRTPEAAEARSLLRQ